MVDIEYFRKLALSFPDTEEQPHFDIPSFRWKGKIFATYHTKDDRAMLKLTPIDQSVYHDMDGEVFFPVNGTWGAQGATFVDMKKVNKRIFKEALTLAYNTLVEKSEAKKKPGKQ